MTRYCGIVTSHDVVNKYKASHGLDSTTVFVKNIEISLRFIIEFTLTRKLARELLDVIRTL